MVKKSINKLFFCSVNVCHLTLNKIYDTDNKVERQQLKDRNVWVNNHQKDIGSKKFVWLFTALAIKVN
jgi:hypothetical protein